MSSDNISIVVSIDFGTTFSGLAFAKKVKPNEIDVNEIRLNNIWLGRRGLPKTNTALLYHVNECLNLHSKWGEQALYYEAPKKAKEQVYYIIERFKLLLNENVKDNIPILPESLDVKTVIADYLIKMKEVIEEILETRCKGIPLSEVLFVLTVPAEWHPHTRNILRECMYKSKLLVGSSEHRLEFMTEPEAAAIYCLLFVEKPPVGDTYLVVDCGGGTVDLTVRTMLPDKTLDEETVRSGGLCGSTFVDQEFLKFLEGIVGFEALEKFKEKNYGSLQKLIYKFFCPEVKLPFDGDSDKFETIGLDLQWWCPPLIKYITGEAREKLESVDWVVDLEFEDVKRMFDPAVDKIIVLINEQLKNLPEQQKVKTMFLVGGFSESIYLFKRIKSVFKNRIPTVTIPPDPIAAIAKGACYYGLNKNIIKTRRLKWSYGIEVKYRHDDKIIKFDALAYKGEKLKVNEERSRTYETVKSNQLLAKFNIIYSNLSNPKYISQGDVKSLGSLTINLPLAGFGTIRKVEFFLKFAEEELRVMARNKDTKETYHYTFNYPSGEFK